MLPTDRASGWGVEGARLTASNLDPAPVFNTLTRDMIVGVLTIAGPLIVLAAVVGALLLRRWANPRTATTAAATATVTELRILASVGLLAACTGALLALTHAT